MNSVEGLKGNIIKSDLGLLYLFSLYYLKYAALGMLFNAKKLVLLHRLLCFIRAVLFVPLRQVATGSGWDKGCTVRAIAGRPVTAVMRNW